MTPAWLHLLAVAGLLFGAACAVVIAFDVWLRPQAMAIMNVVWPVVATFGTVFVVWAYFRFGRLSSRKAMQEAKSAGKTPPNKELPFPVMVAKGAAHCGSGCAIGDVIAEFLAFFVPSIAIWLGWKSLFAEKMFAVWVLDYLFAFSLGIAFQYFTIKPMRDLSPAEGLIQAVKADTLSLSAWQVGMYGFMAFAQFYIFRGVLGVPLEVNSAEFWFMMQIAMVVGFVTSYPANWWLLRTGIKERM